MNPIATGRGRSLWVFNGGSSSLKFGIYSVVRGQPSLDAQGEAEFDRRRGHADLALVDDRGRALFNARLDAGDSATALKSLSRRLMDEGYAAPEIIGHRVVHGGVDLLAHCPIDASVLREIARAESMAPLHVPTSLATIRAARGQFPKSAQIACFDTAFHANLPMLARTLAVPATWQEPGMRRYGFHGLSCESVLLALGRPLPRRLVIAHLGSGASVTAVLRGKSIDTTMGLTPGGGLVMGTRSGDLDPGVIFYAMRRHRLNAVRAEALLEREAGLLGISGRSSDLRQLHRSAGSDPRSRLALEIFCDRVCKAIVTMMHSLGGVDALVFTGGIGEKDSQMRRLIGCRLAWLVREKKSVAAEAPRVLTIPARENDVIARHSWRLGR